MLTTIGEKEVNRNKDRELTRQLALSTQESNKSVKTTNEFIIKIQRMQTIILVVTGVAAILSAIGTFGQWRIAKDQQQQTYKSLQDTKPKLNYLSPLCQDTACATLADTATIKKP